MRNRPKSPAGGKTSRDKIFVLSSGSSPKYESHEKMGFSRMERRNNGSDQ